MSAHDDAGAAFLRLQGISKQFGSIRALAGVDFEVRRGEVMALVGENGAGKSTMVKILAGLHKPDEGDIFIEGEAADLSSVLKSERARVAVVQQELSLVPTMSIAENVFLGDIRHGRFSTPKRLAHRAAPFLRTVGLDDLDPDTLVEDLRVAERQLIEVARLLARDAQVLIFDEPTAALSDAEIERIMRVVRSLRDDARSVIYVTHRLSEVFAVADRVTVFRDGQSQEPTPTSELNVDRLIERMLGGALEQMYPPPSTGFGDVVLEVRDVRVSDGVNPITLNVSAGEILGLAGQIGSGTSALLRAVAGAAPRLSGLVVVAGTAIPPYRLRDAMKAGVSYCSPDRKFDGLFLLRPVRENLTAPSLHRVSDRGWLSRKRERDISREIADLFQVDAKRMGSAAGTLSGGNQQKVALGKWMGPRPKLLLVDEPTRGVDVGARSEIYRHLRHLAEDGLAIVVASSDIQEVLGLADTVATFYRGKLVNLAARTATDAAKVMRDVTHPTEDAA
jgi:ABC-type sugar transport system ATPase subunit